MMLTSSYSRQAKKFLKSSEKGIAARIVEKIEELQKNPFPKEVKRIQGFREKLFRVRVGDYRILYEIDNKMNVLGIVKIDKRSRVYE